MLSNDAKLTPGSLSSEQAGMIPHAFTAASKAKTYLMIRSSCPLKPIVWSRNGSATATHWLLGWVK
jgi:hypothetical protein